MKSHIKSCSLKHKKEPLLLIVDYADITLWPSLNTSQLFLPQTSMRMVINLQEDIRNICQRAPNLTLDSCRCSVVRIVEENGTVRRQEVLCVCVCARACQRTGTYNVQRSHVPPPHSVQWVQAANASTFRLSVCDRERGEGGERKIK